jgi:hypothetical protein
VSDEAKKEGPDYIATAKVPAMTDRAMLEDLYRVTKGLDKKVDTLGLQVDVVTDQQVVFGQRLTLVEKRQDDMDGRTNSHSGGIKNLSGVDMKLESSLAVVSNKVDALEKKTDAQTAMLAKAEEDNLAIKKAVTGFLKDHPQLVTLFVTVVSLALGALAATLKAHQ